MNWNPFRRKNKSESVYIAVTLDQPLGAITKSPKSDKWIKVNLSLEAAAELIPSKSINWHTVPMDLRAKLEIDFNGLEMDWADLQKWLK